MPTCSLHNWQIALHHTEYLETLESAMATIIEKMAGCKYYATMYVHALKVHFDPEAVIHALRERFEFGILCLYDAVLAFVNKAQEYFDSGKPGEPPTSRLRLPHFRF